MIIHLIFESSLAIAYSGLSAINVEKNKLELAEIYAQKSLEIQKNTSESTSIANTLK
jgi:hypothetical protein